MNQPTQTLSAATLLASAAAGARPTDRHKLLQRIELAGLAVLLLVLNWSVFQGVCDSTVMRLPAAER